MTTEKVVELFKRQRQLQGAFSSSLNKNSCIFRSSLNKNICSLSSPLTLIRPDTFTNTSDQMGSNLTPNILWCSVTPPVVFYSTSITFNW